MNFVFLMDPLHTVIMEKDTSFILMLGASRKGHRVYFMGDGGMVRQNGKIIFHAVEVTPQQVSSEPFVVKEPKALSEDDVDAVFIRSDPPFDAQYLLNTWLLDLLPERIVVINQPAGIRTVNEKLWATQFPSLVPRTLVGRDKKSFLQFLKDEKEIIAKPTDGFGGQGIFHIKSGDANTNVILESLTQNYTRDIILQQYVPEAKNGDKRILLLNGDILGAVLRLHSKDDHRNNFFSGGKPAKTGVTARDKEIAEALKPHLQRLGLYFVGIDIMGDYLIEVNVTSPTCLQEMNNLYGAQLEDQVIVFVEKLVDQKG